MSSKARFFDPELGEPWESLEEWLELGPHWRESLEGTVCQYDEGLLGVVAPVGGGFYAGILFNAEGAAMSVPFGDVTPIGAQWSVDGAAFLHLRRRRAVLFGRWVLHNGRFVRLDPPIAQ